MILCPMPRTVLIVDDDPHIRQLLVFALQKAGLDTIEAADGEAGLTLAGTHAPSLVILDINMPRMDGLEVCRRLRARADGAALRIVALTGWGTTEDRELTRQAGFDHHLVKPVTAAKLREALAAVTERA